MTAPSVPTSVRLRPLGREDGPALLELHRRCPIVGDLTFWFDRAPDFFRWPETVFDGYTYVGAYVGSELVAAGGVFVRAGRDGRGGNRICYVGDARVVPRWRGSRLSERIFAELTEQVPPDVSVGFALVKRGNRPAERLVATARPSGWLAEPLGGYATVSLSPALPPRRRGGYRVREVTPEDFPALARLLSEAAGSRLFAPPFSPDWLARRWAVGATSRLWLLAERADRCVGALLLQDTAEDKRTVVLSRTPGTRLLGGVHRLAASLRGVPALPAPGHVLRAFTALAWAASRDDRDAARELLAVATRHPITRGRHLLQVGVVDDEPLRSVLRGTLHQNFAAGLTLLHRVGAPPTVTDRRPWIDPVAV